MKIQSIDIFGKKYQVQLGLKNSELTEINTDINTRLKTLMVEYSNLDKIDILIFYIIELHEKLYFMKRQLAKQEEKLRKISEKLVSVEKKIKNEIENLDR